MPRVLWKVLGQDQILPVRCSASGREDFSTYESFYRARQTILNGSAEYALVIEDGQIVARFERTPTGDAVQVSGKDYL